MTAPATANTPVFSASTHTAFDEAVKTVRFLSIDAIEKANSGHPGAPMGLATIAVELFANHLVYNPEDPAWPNRDRFVLSGGHASMLLYSVLHLSGYDLSVEDIKNFRQWGSKTPGHPEYSDTPGVETTTGPLGQGIGNAVGMALASKLAAARSAEGDKTIDYSVYAICGDGDLMEGVAYEAMSFAGHQKLDNLVLVYDDNSITIDGTTDISFTEDVGKRCEGLGWFVQKIDGHDVDAVRAALSAAKQADRPALIVAKTHIGFGAPTKQDSSASHGAALGADEVKGTKEAAGWPLEPTFHVPSASYEVFVARATANRAIYEAWQAQPGEFRLSAASPDDLFEKLIAVAGDKADATRSHAGRIQQTVAELCPALVGGSADLAGSNKTTIKGAGDVRASDFSGRNINFGVREHGMGAIQNGLALSGMFVPFSATFLIFGDYMRPPMRLAALMKQQSVYVFSHDSVFLGEDGPTHQPVEQLWTMRMVPNLDVVRPADAMECAAAWAYAMQRTDGPTVLSLTRHKVPPLDRPSGFDPKSILDGAYVVSDEDNLDLVLMATGSEVSVAIEAKSLLAAAGKKVRIVSMPCVDAFLRLSSAKQAEILPPGIRRASFELGITGPWKMITGLDGIEVGVDRFGASAPWEVIQEKFGVTAKAAAEKILAAL